MVANPPWSAAQKVVGAAHSPGGHVADGTSHGLVADDHRPGGYPPRRAPVNTVYQGIYEHKIVSLPVLLVSRPYPLYLKAALGIAALSAARTTETYLATKYRRISSRRGPLPAIVAIEHAMLIAIWNMITHGVCYHEPGADFYTQLNPDKAKNRALDQLRKMGYAVTLTPWRQPGNSKSSRQWLEQCASKR
jgi:hypothetical protein